MRLFVRGVLIGLVTAAPNGFHLDIKKFARYLGAPIVLIDDKEYYRKNNFAYYNKNRLKEAKHGKQQ